MTELTLKEVLNFLIERRSMSETALISIMRLKIGNQFKAFLYTEHGEQVLNLWLKDCRYRAIRNNIEEEIILPEASYKFSLYSDSFNPKTFTILNQIIEENYYEI